MKNQERAAPFSLLHMELQHVKHIGEVHDIVYRQSKGLPFKKGKKKRIM